MASYPGSVKSFTTKNTSDIIQAAHVNELQDEVNAIEAGLLNGTARLNSSHSTLVALSVTGGSTVGTLSAGASTLASLSVTGGSTFGAMTLGASTLASLSVTGASTVTTLQAGASTITSLVVSGGSTLGTWQAGASTHTSLVVSGGSTLGTVQAGASTATSLSVSGGSTLGTVNAGASTVTSLVVSGAVSAQGNSTFNGAVHFGVQLSTLVNGNTNDFALDSTATIVYLTANSSGSTLTGMTGGAAGRVVYLAASSVAPVAIAGESAGSAAANRFMRTSTISTGMVLTFVYVNSRWLPGPS